MTTPKKGTVDFPLLILSIGLVLFGLVMVFSASSMMAAYWQNDPLYFSKRQVVFLFLGLLGLIFFSSFPYEKFRKLAFFFLALTLFSLFLVLLIGTGPQGSGIRSWFRIGSFGIQPAEFAKLALIIYLASFISRKGNDFKDFQKGLLPALIVVGMVAGAIFLQPDLGTTSVIVITSMILMFVGGTKYGHFLIMAAISIFPIIAIINQKQYIIDRFTTFLNPFEDEQKSGYQLARSLYAFGNGGITGTGFGQSVLKLQYLPEAHNDFIFAIIGEELGLIGSFLFILVYALFIWRGIVISLRCQDRFGMLLGIGIMSMFGIQAMINIGGVTASIPLTGVTLPLISYGGSSLLVSLASIGILLGISRRQNLSQSRE
jgi:cell division protein FtsW